MERGRRASLRQREFGGERNRCRCQQMLQDVRQRNIHATGGFIDRTVIDLHHFALRRLRYRRATGKDHIAVKATAFVISLGRQQGQRGTRKDD